MVRAFLVLLAVSSAAVAQPAYDILIKGGQPRWWPSPGSLWVASIPSLVPAANSVVAWSSTSAGPLVKIASRRGTMRYCFRLQGFPSVQLRFAVWGCLVEVCDEELQCSTVYSGNARAGRM